MTPATPTPSSSRPLPVVGLLLDVYPHSTLGGGPHSTAAGAAEGYGHHAVDIGEEDGHPDGDGQPGQQGGDEEGGGHSARDGEDPLEAARGQVPRMDLTAHPHRQTCTSHTVENLKRLVHIMYTAAKWHDTIFVAYEI